MGNGNGSTMIAGYEMQERHEPELIKFGEGECVEGVLLNVVRVNVGEPPKPVTKFIVDRGEGDLVSFLGSYEIVAKLKMEDRGHFISVRYEGEDKSVTRNGNALKRFKVLVSKSAIRTGKALENSGLGITDDDIPF